MDRQVESLVAGCIFCQATNNKRPPEPLKMTTMPQVPRDVVHGDFCGPFPTGEYLLKWPCIVHSTKTSTTISQLQKIFSVHGYPRQFVSDNGPSYN